MCDKILHPLKLEELARNWLLEDTSSFDFGGIVIEKHESEFDIFMQTPGMLAGIPFANAIFTQLGVTPYWYNSDGHRINSVTKIARVSGSANKLLLAEEVVLNVLSRASGVATITSKMLEHLKNAGWKGILSGTNKTTPGFRMIEKYALLIGGADMHRYDLSNMVVLKENHISVAGSIEQAVKRVREVCGFSIKIEVECRSFEEAIKAGRSSCDIIMLDSFKPEELVQHALSLKIQFPTVLIEASGGITEQNMQEYVCPWIDIISSNNLVQSYPIIDFSMKVRTQTITLDG